MALAGLEVADAESLRRHYARTCLEWASASSKTGSRRSRPRGQALPHLAVYLAGCAHGFEHEWMNVYQVLARKEGAAFDPLPLTRDYMYRAG